MRNLLLHIAYNGSRYHGYQVQQNAVSVAGTFQPVLEKILAERCSSRAAPGRIPAFMPTTLLCRSRQLPHPL